MVFPANTITHCNTLQHTATHLRMLLFHFINVRYRRSISEVNSPAIYYQSPQPLQKKKRAQKHKITATHCLISLQHTATCGRGGAIYQQSHHSPCNRKSPRIREHCNTNTVRDRTATCVMGVCERVLVGVCERAWMGV